MNSRAKGHAYIDNVFRIVEFSERAPGDFRLSDVASSLDLNMSTCHHILKKLIAIGVLTRGVGRRYKIGRRYGVDSNIAPSSIMFPSRIDQVLSGLASCTGETINWCTLTSTGLRQETQLLGRRAVRVDLDKFLLELSFHAFAGGKAIIAAVPPKERAKMLKTPFLFRFTHHTRIHPQENDCYELDDSGTISDYQEFCEGVCSISAPVYRQSKFVVGSITVSLPIFRVTSGLLSELVGQTSQAASLASSMLQFSLTQG